MDNSRQCTLQELLDECYDVQLELEDASELYEILISDIETVSEEISEYLERVRTHLGQVENSFRNYNNGLQYKTISNTHNDLPWE